MRGAIFDSQSINISIGYHFNGISNHFTRIFYSNRSFSIHLR